MAEDYSTISNPYDTNLAREPEGLSFAVGGNNIDSSVTQQSQALAQAGGNTAASNTAAGGPTQQASVASGGALSDVTISSSIQSANWAPKKTGFYINGLTGYAEFSNVFVAGAVTTSQLDIPDSVTDNSFHVDTAGDTWWGTTPTLFTANHDNALAYVLKTGIAKFQNVAITGGSVVTSVLSGTIAQANLNIADRGWAQTCVFSVTDADTVAWGVGTFTSADGTAYSIGAGNTGNMAAKTYIYLDIAVSSTVYQTTTTATTAVGVGKVMIAVAQSGTGEATFSVLQGQGGQNIDAASIVAGSITANEIAASTITAGKMSISTLSSITANIGSITAGSITGITITGSTITGSTIQTATSGLRVRMTSSPTNKIEFLNGSSVEGVLSIEQSGDDFQLNLGGDGGGYLTIVSSVGASQVYGVSMPFFSAAGKASFGQVTIEGSPNFPTLVGLDWSGGSVASFRFDLGSSIAHLKIPVGTNMY